MSFRRSSDKVAAEQVELVAKAAESVVAVLERAEMVAEPVPVETEATAAVALAR